jgi:nitroreductase
VEAGSRAPSASNRQHWDFIVVTDRAKLADLATVWRAAGHIAGAAAAIALVLPVPEDERTKVIDQYDLGQATYAIMLAATDLGIGTGHSSVGDLALARGILGVPATHEVAYLLSVGYPADRPLRPIAKPLHRRLMLSRLRRRRPLRIRARCRSRAVAIPPDAPSPRRPVCKIGRPRPRHRA